MSNNDPVNKNSITRGPELELELLIQGARTLPADLRLTVDGEDFTPETFAQRAESELSPIKAVRNAKRLLAQARVERREHAEATKLFIANARAAIQGALGATNPDLERFGIKPRKERTPETLPEKVARVAKAKATRASRDPTPAKEVKPGN